MAQFWIEYYSEALCRKTTFYAVIPNDRTPDPLQREGARRPMKALFVLHGYTGRSENWIPEELLERYNVAVFSPTAENSFYLDAEATGHRYETMLAVELVDYVRKTFGLAQTPEDTYIAGISMGGYGAVHTALKHPDRFGKAAGLSSALIVHDIDGLTPESPTNHLLGNYAYFHGCFGDLSTVARRDTNPEVVIRSLKASGTPIPQLYLCCGTEDFLLEQNRAFHRFLVSDAVPHEYHESKGGHDPVFWSEYAVRMASWMFGGE